MRKKITVLLTGIGGNTAQGFARSLLKFRSEFNIIGSDSDKYNVRFGNNYSDRVYLVPKPDAEDYIALVSRIVEKEKVDLVVPSPDPEVSAISKHRQELDAAILLPDQAVIETAQDKWLTYVALEGKARQPRSILIERYEDLERSFSEINKTLWLRNRRGAGGSRSFVANTLDEAEFWVEYWKGYGQFVASEMLLGRNLCWIGLYKNGELVSSGGYHRLRYFSAHVSPTGITGNVNAGMTIHDDRLNAAAEQAVAAMDKKPNGVYTVDLKENGDPNITEVNAGRFHASFYVYAEAGLNLPYYYAKLAVGESVKLPQRRNALKAGLVTIRNLDNDPVMVWHDDLGKSILTP